MDISVVRVIPNDFNSLFIRVIVHLHENDDEQPDESLPLQSADFDVWIEKADVPLSEIEARALKKVKDFLSAAQGSFCPE